MRTRNIAILLLTSAIIMQLFVIVGIVFLYKPLNGLEGNAMAEVDESAHKTSSMTGKRAALSIRKNLFGTEYAKASRAYGRTQASRKSSIKATGKGKGLVLKGIVRSTKGYYEAYIQVDSEQTVALQEGREEAGVKVLEIRDRTVFVRRNNNTIKLEL